MILARLGLSLLLAACGPRATPVGTADTEPAPTPAATAGTPAPAVTPSPEPTLAATAVQLASGIRGAGEVAVASDGDGALVAWISADGDGRPLVTALLLDSNGVPRGAAATISSASDVEDDLPSDDVPIFDRLVAGFDGADYVVAWRSERSVYQHLATEESVRVRRVGRDGAITPDLLALFVELQGVGFCNGATSGPLASATTDSGALLFFVNAFGCAGSQVAAGAVPLRLARGASVVDGIAVEPSVGVIGLEFLSFLLSSTATVAARPSDALILWIGGFTEPGSTTISNAILIEGSRGTPFVLSGATDVASDGSGYLVLESMPVPEDGPRRELQAAPFDVASRSIDPAARTTLAETDHGPTALAAFGHGRYLVAYEDRDAPAAPLRLLSLTVDGASIASSVLATADGGELLDLATASSAAGAVLVQTRREPAGTFRVDAVKVAVR